MQILYAYEFTAATPSQITEDVCDRFSDSAMEFVRESVRQVIDQRNALDELIREHSDNWDFERIALIDRILMRIGINEFLNCDDIPPKVSINEVIEISKRYSTEKSSKFINGILDAVFERLRKAGKIQKTGRGVIDA